MSTTARLTAALLGIALVAPTSAAALAPSAPLVVPTSVSCPTVYWGSLPKQLADTRAGDGTLTNVRAGRHACFDRVVIDVAGVAPDKVGYSLAYVDAVRSPGSGQVVPLSGGARLQLTVSVPAYDAQGRATYTPRDRSRVVDVTGWNTLRQVAYAASFEGQTTFGVGVRARLPYRVFLLDGPGTGSRVVIDVAHRW